MPHDRGMEKCSDRAVRRDYLKLAEQLREARIAACRDEGSEMCARLLAAEVTLGQLGVSLLMEERFSSAKAG